MPNTIECNHNSATAHIFQNPFCENLDTIEKVGIVAFHIFTLGLPLLIYHLMNDDSNKSVKAKKEEIENHQIRTAVENSLSTFSQNAQNKEDKPSRSPINMPRYFSDLAEKIRMCPPYKPEEMTYHDFTVSGVIPTRDYASLFIHAHEVLPHVFLGDYRSFLSVDPEFVERYPMADELNQIFDGSPSSRQKRWAEQKLDLQGCSNKNIKVVVSVTQFKSSAQEEEWSTFEPNLDKLNIRRIQIPVDDVMDISDPDAEDPWYEIESHFDEVFKEIDSAIQGNGNILIHCVKGASRSAAVFYAYLMNRCTVSLEEAHNYVISIRHQAELKPTMKKHLEDYRERLSQSAN